MYYIIWTMEVRRVISCTILLFAMFFAGLVAGTPNWYTALTRPEWWQVLIAAVGIAVIAWQAFLTRKAIETGNKSVETFISKERARLRIDLEELDLSLQPNGVYEVKFAVSIFGTTPAFIIDTKCVAFHTPSDWIDYEELGDAVMFPLHYIPAVFPANSEPIQDFAIFHFDSEGHTQQLIEGIEADRLFVVIRGFIIYKDVFDRERETRFRYVWKYRDKTSIPGLKRWGNWEKCGKDEENKET